MKTHRCHLLACSLFLLTCIQPAKAMEEDGSQRDILAIRADLARFETLSVRPAKNCPKFSVRFAQLNTVLRLTPTAENPDWMQKHPILTAAISTRAHFNYLLAIENKNVSVHALCKQAASLMLSLVTSREFLDEAKDTGNYYE